MKKMTRVALITSGGDCQGLNAAMRGIGKALYNKIENLEIFGMYDGYRGLIDGDYIYMEPKDFSGGALSGIAADGDALLVTDTATLAALNDPGAEILRDYGDVFWDVRMNLNDATGNFASPFTLPEAPQRGAGRK